MANAEENHSTLYNNKKEDILNNEFSSHENYAKRNFLIKKGNQERNNELFKETSQDEYSIKKDFIPKNKMKDYYDAENTRQYAREYPKSQTSYSTDPHLETRKDFIPDQKIADEKERKRCEDQVADYSHHLEDPHEKIIGKLSNLRNDLKQSNQENFNSFNFNYYSSERANEFSLIQKKKKCIRRKLS
jgi:hypothetical protein